MKTRKPKYKDICTAAYYGDVALLRKKIEVVAGEDGELGPPPDDMSPAARETMEEAWAAAADEPGFVTTYADAVRCERYGFGFAVEEVREGVYRPQFKLSRKSETPATPLHWAVLGHELEAVHYLLTLGAKAGVRVSKFGVRPLDVAVHNGFAAVANALREEAAELFGYVEDLTADLDRRLEGMAHAAVRTRADIEVADAYYKNDAGVRRLFRQAAAATADGDDAAGVDDGAPPDGDAPADGEGEEAAAAAEPPSPPPAAPEREGQLEIASVPWLSEEEGAARVEALTQEAQGDPLQDLVRMLSTTVGRLSLLAQRLPRAAAGEEGGDAAATPVQLLALTLLLSDAAGVRALLEPEADSEVEYPDLFTAYFSCKPLALPPAAEEAAAAAAAAAADGGGTPAVAAPPLGGGLDIVLRGRCQDVVPKTLYCWVKEPAEEWAAAVRALSAGDRRVLQNSVCVGEEGVLAKAEEEKKGVLLEVRGVSCLFDPAEFSRFPSEAHVVLPPYTPVQVVEVSGGGEEEDPLVKVVVQAEDPLLAPKQDVEYEANKLLEKVAQWQEVRCKARRVRADARRLADPPPPTPPADEEEPAEEEGEG